SQAAAREVKEHGRANDLFVRLRNDAAFEKVNLTSALDPKQLIGLAPEPGHACLRDVIEPIRRRLGEESRSAAEDLRVRARSCLCGRGFPSRASRKEIDTRRAR